MIVDKLIKLELYSGLSERIHKALLYLKQNNFSEMKDGCYEIDGQNIYASVSRYQTKPIESGKWEAHKKYIDVQYVAEGTEKMGYAPVSNLTLTQEYSEEKDIILFSGTGDFVTIESGTFAIFFPGEGHMPGMDTESRSQKILKVVVKVIAI